MRANDADTERWQRRAVVVKVGGSLFDWPELKTRLPRFLATFDDKTVIVVPGGGKAADIVRELDNQQRLGAEISHWLALRALSLNAYLLAELLPGVRVVEGLNASHATWRRGGASIVDVFRFARGDESRRDHLPHSWSVTSDSLAARIAVVADAVKLVLLKSTDPPANSDWPAAARQGYVDEYFPTAVAGVPFEVAALNFRNWLPVSSQG